MEGPVETELVDLEPLVEVVPPFPLADVKRRKYYFVDHDAGQEQSEALEGPEGAIVDESWVATGAQPQHNKEEGSIRAQPDEEHVGSEDLVLVLCLELGGPVSRESLRARTGRRWSVTPGDIVEVAEGVDGEDVDEDWNQQDVG